MSEVCEAKIKPFPGDTIIRCEKPPDKHNKHRGVLRDYAYEGSETAIEWLEDDRRNFYEAEFSPCSADLLCKLPNNHRGRHAH